MSDEVVDEGWLGVYLMREASGWFWFRERGVLGGKFLDYFIHAFIYLHTLLVI